MPLALATERFGGFDCRMPILSPCLKRLTYLKSSCAFALGTDHGIRISSIKAPPTSFVRPSQLSLAVAELQALSTRNFQHFGPVIPALRGRLLAALFRREGAWLTVGTRPSVLMLATKQRSARGLLDICAMPSFTFQPRHTQHFGVAVTAAFLCDIHPKTWLQISCSRVAMLKRYAARSRLSCPMRPLATTRIDLEQYRDS